jgi:hypothetical protein
VQRECYRCGSPVEDQTAFCPSCGAPQIRVTNEQLTTLPQAVNRVAEQPLSPVEAASAQSPESSAHTGRSKSLLWGKFLRTALPLAFLTSLACLMNPFFGWLMLLGTVIWGTLHYQRKHASHISAGLGARLGAFMGLLTFGFLFLLVMLDFALSVFVWHNAAEIREELVKKILQTMSQNPDPRALEMAHWLTEGHSLVFFLVLGLLIFLVLLLLSATAAGAVAGGVSSKKGHH